MEYFDGTHLHIIVVLSAEANGAIRTGEYVPVTEEDLEREILENALAGRLAHPATEE